MLKVSIITPSFNQAKYLEDTILSVRQQQYPALEHIVIDGGSHDGSVDIIRKHEDKITFWISGKDSGQSDAINKGLSKASGDIITWLNSDDLLMPDTVSRVVEIFQNNPKTHFVHGRAVLFGEGRKEKIIGDEKKELEHRYLAYIPFPQPSSFFRRKIIEETGSLDANLHYGMDFDLLARTALLYNIQYTPLILSKYRLHAQAKTNDVLAFCKDWSLVFSKVLRSFDFSGQLIHAYRALGLYVEGLDKYAVGKNFSVDDLKKSFLYHLLILFHYHYNANSFDQVKRIGEMVREFDDKFFQENQMGQIIKKAKYLNPFLINLIRKIKSGRFS